MFSNYLHIAWRSFSRHPWYSLINIGCLAIGLATTMTILLYFLHEHSYDRWHANSGRIFAVHTTSSFGGVTWPAERVSYPVGPAGKNSLPVVESMVRVREAFEGVDLQNPTSQMARFRETSRFLYADSNFFRFFSFRLLRGDANTVLARPFSVVLTQTAAKKYFGNSDPVGKTLMLDKQYPLLVTGMVADMPSNSSIGFDLVASLSTMRNVKKYKPYLENQQLESGSFYTWLLLRQASDTAVAGRSLSNLGLADAGKTKKSDAPYGMTESHQFSLMPLIDMHLEGYGGANKQYLSAFTWVAILILTLTLVNYMSLATARSTMRAREVGVRKVIGAGRGRIVAQFYTESAMHTIMAFALGVLLFLSFRPHFCNLMQMSIDAGFLASPMVLGSFAVLLLLVTGIAGSYPSLVLSSFRPVKVLYGKLSRNLGGERIRKAFLVFQFSLSMALMTCAFVIGKELYYIRHVDTGVTRANIVMFPFAATMDHYAPYQAEIAAIPGIRQVATTRYKLYQGTMLVQLAQLPGKTTTDQLQFMVADSNLIPMLDLKWAEKPDDASNWYGRSNVILNETAVDAFQSSGRATGNHFKFGEDVVNVAGVLKDFNFLSLHAAILPLGVRIARNPDDEWLKGIDGVLYTKIAPHVNVTALIEAVHRVYTRHDKQTPFEFTFLDDEFNRQYKAEDQLARLMNIFTTITIVVACLGLLALATFAAQQRLKEIGIRKVLGASTGSIGALLSRDFLRPVLLAILIACPLSWWLMNKWLEDFAYRTTLTWWLFVAPGLGLLLVALGTVLSRSLQAARTNPVDNLRTE